MSLLSKWDFKLADGDLFGLGRFGLGYDDGQNAVQMRGFHF